MRTPSRTRSAEALGYLHKGFSADASLPETTFGRLYPETGHLRRYQGQRHVDTHYPPGPTWLAAAMRQACGARPLSCLRTLPLAVSGIGAFVLAFALIVTLGLRRGLVVALAAFAVPLYSNMMLGLHYQGYALALLSIQLGGLLFLYGGGRPLAARDLALAGGLGFLQGWLSFDYFFLVAFAAVPIAVLFSDLREPSARKRLLALVAVSTGGFAFAHALHFLQVVAYYGDFMAALNDLLGVARERADPSAVGARASARVGLGPMDDLQHLPVRAREARDVLRLLPRLRIAGGARRAGTTAWHADPLARDGSGSSASTRARARRGRSSRP